MMIIITIMSDCTNNKIRTARRDGTPEDLYRVYQKKLNRFEIALNFAKQLFVSGFLYI
jgi:hypothetical protein